MYSLADDFRAGLFTAHEPPCLSMYLPTHRHAPENRQDPIRFRNLVKQLDASLRRAYPGSEVKALLRPFEELAGDRPFWEHTLDGLAVLAADGLFRVYLLRRSVPELAVAAASFHVKPLLRELQPVGGYQILGLNRREVEFFEGDRDVLHEVEPAKGVPRTIADALGSETAEPHLTVASYGGAGGASAMRHGHGDRKQAVDTDTERFFRAVDQAVLEHHSQPSGLPLILAALPEHHDVFRRVSRNPFLLPDGIPMHPDDLALDTLRERAWQAAEARYVARLAALAGEFREAASKGLGADDPARIAEAVSQGRVGTLLLEAERTVPGSIDAATGAVAFGDLDDPEVGDLLDDLAGHVLAKGGEVIVMPAASMPSATGAAAIFRF